jgi:hypothetical protein
MPAAVSVAACGPGSYAHNRPCCLMQALLEAKQQQQQVSGRKVVRVAGAVRPLWCGCGDMLACRACSGLSCRRLADPTSAGCAQRRPSGF